jgi:NAD(P)-dependent dehydrogenase (short-subunit alcohol dehydrogenase family)
MRLDGKVALVTGATSGVGRAVARRFAHLGCDVVALDLDAGEGAALEREVAGAAGRVAFEHCDVGRATDIARAVDAIASRWGRIDILVSNAATMTFKPLLELDEAHWDRVLDVNLKAPFLLARQAVPHMPEGGSIVAVSSVHAVATTVGVAPYAASKAGLEGLVRALAVELTDRRIRVNAVRLGAIDTPMLWGNPNVQSGAEKIDPASVGSPEAAAAAIAFLASGEAEFITGAVLAVDGGRLARLG